MKLTNFGIFSALLIPLLWSFGQATHHRKSEPLDIIQTTVLEIYEHLKKQDKFQDIKDLLQIDSTLKKIEQQNEELLKSMGNNLGRSGVSDNSVQHLETKLDTIEEQLVANVQGGIKKMSDVEKQTSDLKNEMDKKLQKMMNVMSSVYDMSLKVSDKFAGERKEDSDNDGTNLANFMAEYFEGIEKKIVESFSVMQRQFNSEIVELSSSLSAMSETCETLSTDVTQIKDSCEMGKGKSNSQSFDDSKLIKMTENLVQNLTRRQREISEKMEKQILELEAHVFHHLPISRSHHPRDSKNTKPVLPQPQNELLKKQDLPRAQNAFLKENPIPCKSTASVTNPKSCLELYNSGATCNGTYIIYPQNKKAIFVYCDMEAFGGGWTVLMRRGDGSSPHTNFDRNWNDYKKGFGEVTGEFWLGNDNIHYLTKQEEMILQIILESYDSEKLVLEYEPFSVASESENYKLHIGRPKGNLTFLGSSLRHHNMRPFSTFDQNNGGNGAQNCAARFKGGWWYNRCHYALLTAPYFKESENRAKHEGIQWHAWKGNSILKAAEMRIKPKLQ